MPKSIGKPARNIARRKNSKPVNTVIHISEFATHPNRKEKKLQVESKHKRKSNIYITKYEHGNRTIISKKIYVRGIPSDDKLHKIMKKEIRAFSKNKRNEITFSVQHYQGKVKSRYTALILGKKTPAARIQSIRKFKTLYKKEVKPGEVKRVVIGSRKRTAKQLYEDFEDLYVAEFEMAYKALSFEYEVTEDESITKIGIKSKQSKIKGKLKEQSKGFKKLQDETKLYVEKLFENKPTLIDEAFVRGKTISGIPMRRK